MFPSRIAAPTLVVMGVILAFSAGAASGSRTLAIHHGRHARARVTAQACSNANTPATAASRASMRDAVVCLINQQRVRQHLPPLHAARALDRSAQGWTNVMVDTGRFTHGADFAGRISSAGYVWASAGENIATGFQTPAEVVKAWMASLDHCQNILDPTFSDVGTGLSTHRLGQYSPATWTQDFGLWMGHRPPSGNHGPQNGCPYHI